MKSKSVILGSFVLWLLSMPTFADVHLDMKLAVLEADSALSSAAIYLSPNETPGNIPGACFEIGRFSSEIPGSRARE